MKVNEMVTESTFIYDFNRFPFFMQVEAVELIAEGKAPCIKQTEEGATYDAIWKKKAVVKVSLFTFPVCLPA